MTVAIRSTSFIRNFSDKVTEELIRQLNGLPDNAYADCMELLRELRKTKEEDQAREIVKTLAEIIINEPVKGLAADDMELPSRVDFDGTAAAGKLADEASRFGRNLKRIRKAKRFHQDQLAALSNMTQPQISYLERGEHRPQESTVHKLAAVLGVSSSDLLD
jgi:DNA-binding XRE family transcriptional regulator